ncbi:hypothetical protein NQ317_009255 [Molorchus minor]|uniref:Serine carboxypeptidase S28 n=1 Tax=Molorchus minor TaxID=1323400 RepID=A0ABQ9JCG6_9CUCU|nr:hypothetical protein NQ317_009255 [Molorchus minor]
MDDLIPLPSKIDLSIEKMRYLTSAQALADMAYFISLMNEEYNLSPDVKWIVFGGSYAGTLAAWARLKYPHLIHGAVSAKDDAENTLNLANFFGAITDIFAEVAQYNKLFSELSSTDDICTILRNEEIGTEIYRLAEYANGITKSAQNLHGFKQQTKRIKYLEIDFFVQQCIDVYDEKFNETFISDRVLEANINYGALNINVSNVVYVYGSYDPWTKVGLAVTTNPDSPEPACCYST